MKIACCTTGFRELPLGQTLSLLEGMGFQYIEGTTDGRAHLYPYVFGQRETEELEKMLSRCKAKMVAMMGGWSDFAVEDSKLEEQYDSLRRQIALCQRLGIGILRIFAGYIPRHEVDEACVQRVIRNIKRFVPEAEAAGIRLVMENHYGITATAVDMLRLLEGVSSPVLQANFDAANFVPMGENPVRACERLLPYIGHTHLKDARYTGNGQFNGYEYCELGRGIIDYPSILSLLRERDYQGFLSVKYEKREDIIRGTEASYLWLLHFLKELAPAGRS